MNLFCFCLCVIAILFGGPLWLLAAICFWVALSLIKGKKAA